MSGKLKFACDYLMIILGVVMMACAVNLVYEPLEMVTGGISGLSIVVKHISKVLFDVGVPVWLGNVILNVPIFIWGYVVKGKRYIGRSMVANLSFSAALMLIPVAKPDAQDYVLAAISGGVLNGVGIGLVFRAESSTGGTDLLGSIICRYMPHYPVSSIIFVLDAIVIFLGAAVFGIYNAIYAVVAVFVSAKVMDMVLSGGNVCKQVMIVSKQHEEISRDIIERLGRGVTMLDGRGGYTGTYKSVILCIVGKKQVVQLVEMVKKYDNKAFIIVSETRSVLGEGFIEKY